VPRLLALLVPTLLASLASAASAQIAVVTSQTVGAGLSATGAASCPPGSVAVSGGIDPENVSDMVVTESAPRIGNDPLFALPDGESPAPDGWVASVRNESAQMRSFKVAVACAPDDGNTTTQVASLSLGADASGAVPIDCPTAQTATGGGVSPANTSTMRLLASAPRFDGTSLLDTPDGPAAAPSGWSGAMHNTDAAMHTFKVGAVCRATTGFSAQISSDTVVAGGMLGATVTELQCPSGVAWGGGVEPEELGLEEVTSSAPVFGPDMMDDLFFTTDGTHGPGTGWQVSVRNFDVMDRTLKLAVTCPEPAAGALAGAALAGLAGLARRRRRRGPQ